EPDAPDGLHARLPFAATPRWRPVRRDQIAARALELLVRRLPEPQAHGLGVVQPVLGRLLGHLHPALRDGRVDRPEAVLRWPATHATTTTCSSLAPAGLASARRLKRRRAACRSASSASR